MKNKDYGIEKELIELKHKHEMEKAKYIRDTERMKHEWEMERQRIKTAEIRKNYDRKTMAEMRR